MAILYVAAEGAELKPFAARLSHARKLKWPIDYAFEGIWKGRRVLLAANGAGPKLAARAVEVAVRAVTAAELSSSRLEAVVSVGFCGALTADNREGDVIVADEVLERSTGERFACTPPDESEGTVSHGIIVSQDRVAITAGEKESLAGSGAVAVDMESSGVAIRTARTGLPFSCIKVVTDRVDESFRLDLNLLRTMDGRIARGKIVFYACTHPWLIPELFRLKRRAESAAQALGAFLVECRIHVGRSNAGKLSSEQSNPDSDSAPGELLAPE